MQGDGVSSIESALGRVRFAVLATLVVCAAVAWLARDRPGPLPDALATVATPLSVAIAIGIFVARQIATRAQGAARVRALLAVYVLSELLGLFGVVLVLLGDGDSRGLLFALGGAIFTLGTPPGLGIPARSLVRRG